MTITLHQPIPGGTWRPEDIESTEPLNYEIVDGNLVLISPMKSLWHQTLILELAAALHRSAPEGYRARPELTIGYFRPGATKETLREPDVVVLRPGADPRQGNVFDPHDVVLAVEVESPSTAAIDRLDKVEEYARAGIPTYWRVEQTTDDGAIVHVYEIDEASGHYGLVRSIGPMDNFLIRVPYQVMVDPAAMTASVRKH